jgi:chorismate synthase
MAGNSFGKTLVLTTFGESHGKAVGGVLDGFPSNFPVDLHFIQDELNRRRTGQSVFSSSRKEDDHIEILSGIFEGMTTGAPIAFIAHNIDHKPEDYGQLSDSYRPSHADFTWEQKYGIRDWRGGGRSSARETLARVAGGAFAKMYLSTFQISVISYIRQIGATSLPEGFELNDLSDIRNSRLGCPDPGTETKIIEELTKIKSEGDTAGGVITCIISGVPVGLGEPVFDKLQADLAKSMLTINSVHGFEYGSGFSGAAATGSRNNDIFVKKDGRITTATNHSGGIQGGISNGNDIVFNVAFKPVSTLMMDQNTVNRDAETIVLKGKGRHDVCVVPRALVIVEAMAALVIADHLLRWQQTAPAGSGNEKTRVPR